MFCSLISGSSGNSSLISYKNTNILVDCGMSGKKLEQTLSSLDMSPADLDALLVTHEHIDHTSGIGVISRRYNLPVYTTEGTFLNMKTGKIKDENIKIISVGNPFEIGNIGIKAFSIPHDAKDPVGYNFFYDNKKKTIATDIGVMTNQLFNELSGSESIILEANHDIDMLLKSSYPEPLKNRILSNIGHMSNDLCAKTAYCLVKNGTKNIMLSHLSEENNTPALAFSKVAEALSEIGNRNDVNLKVANRFEVTFFDKR